MKDTPSNSGHTSHAQVHGLISAMNIHRSIGGRIGLRWSATTNTVDLACPEHKTAATAAIPHLDAQLHVEPSDR